MAQDQVERLRQMKKRERKSGITDRYGSGKHPLRLSVTSGKGGVGKSNFALNTAVILSGMKQKVLLIDADTNLANLDILLGITPKFNLSDVITGNKFMRDIIFPGPDGIDILPGSSGDLEMLELADEVQDRLVESFSEVEEQYDFVIIDTGAGLTPQIVGFVISSDVAVIVTNSEPTSNADAYAMIKVITQHNPVLRIRLLINMVGSHDEATDTFERLNLVAQNFLSIPIDYLGYLPVDANVAAAVSRQVPFVRDYPRSPASIALRMIARKLIVGRSSKGPDNGNLMARFFSTKRD